MSSTLFYESFGAEVSTSERFLRILGKFARKITDFSRAIAALKAAKRQRMVMSRRGVSNGKQWTPKDVEIAAANLGCGFNKKSRARSKKSTQGNAVAESLDDGDSESNTGQDGHGEGSEQSDHGQDADDLDLNLADDEVEDAAEQDEDVNGFSDQGSAKMSSAGPKDSHEGHDGAQHLHHDPRSDGWADDTFQADATMLTSNQNFTGDAEDISDSIEMGRCAPSSPPLRSSPFPGSLMDSPRRNSMKSNIARRRTAPLLSSPAEPRPKKRRTSKDDSSIGYEISQSASMHSPEMPEKSRERASSAGLRLPSTPPARTSDLGARISLDLRPLHPPRVSGLHTMSITQGITNDNDLASETMTIAITTLVGENHVYDPGSSLSTAIVPSASSWQLSRARGSKHYSSVGQLFVPVNVDNIHWVLFRIDMNARKALLNDSMQGKGFAFYEAAAKILVDHLLGSGEWATNEWTISLDRRLEQRNLHDCGVCCIFVVLHATAHPGSELPNQIDGTAFRLVFSLLLAPEDDEESMLAKLDQHHIAIADLVLAKDLFENLVSRQLYNQRALCAERGKNASHVELHAEVAQKYKAANDSSLDSYVQISIQAHEDAVAAVKKLDRVIARNRSRIQVLSKIGMALCATRLRREGIFGEDVPTL